MRYATDSLRCTKIVYVVSVDVSISLLIASEHRRTEPEPKVPVYCCFVGSDAAICSRNFETVGPFVYPDDDVSRIPYVGKILPDDKTRHSRRQHLSRCRLKITYRIFK